MNNMTPEQIHAALEQQRQQIQQESTLVVEVVPPGQEHNDRYRYALRLGDHLPFWQSVFGTGPTGTKIGSPRFPGKISHIDLRAVQGLGPDTLITVTVRPGKQI